MIPSSIYQDCPDPATAYSNLIQQEHIQPDRLQEQIIQQLSRLHDQLKHPASHRSTSILRSLFSKNDAPVTKGVYIWGRVGRGKSMLMDLFYHTAPTLKKRRVHFHAFMQEVHQRMHAIRQSGTHEDLATALAKQMRDNVELLCFDELYAEDPADATLLYRLFKQLFEANITIVSTSNREPDTIYTGVQQERFVDFIQLIKANMHICPLDSETDYRVHKELSTTAHYHHPLGKDADTFVQSILDLLVPNATAKPHSFTVQGREITLNLYNEAVAVVDFATLCEQPHAAADYLAITEWVDTLILTHIPQMHSEMRNTVKRFITLIDVLYERKVQLFMTAATPKETLYLPNPHDTKEGFTFQRTLSRLHEMMSSQY